MALMLFLPLIDRHWQYPNFNLSVKNKVLWLSFFICILLMSLSFQQLRLFIIISLFTALPEEWFFRAYMLTQFEQFEWCKCLNKKLLFVNIVTSIIFVLFHFPMQGLNAIYVFFPSMVFGWIYQQYRNILLVILLHSISNFIFILYIRDFLWQKIAF